MESLIDKILSDARTVAVVGISGRPDRPSHEVAVRLRELGYRVVPVNPEIREVLGETAYPSLREVPEKIDLVDVFRKPEQVLPVAEEAIRIGVKYFWMPEGVEHREAEEMLAGAGIPVVANRCILKELAKRGR